MINQELAKIFFEMAKYLQMKENSFRSVAYRKVASTLEGIEENVEDIYNQGGLKALEEIEGLKTWLIQMREEIKEVEKGAFSISWASEMMKRALSVYNELARSNGAVLVRGKKK